MEIKSINIEMDGKEYTMTLDEAKKLYNELDKLFAPKTYTYISPYVDNKPYIWPSITWGNLGNTTT